MPRSQLRRRTRLRAIFKYTRARGKCLKAREFYICANAHVASLQSPLHTGGGWARACHGPPRRLVDEVDTDFSNVRLLFANVRTHVGKNMNRCRLEGFHHVLLVVLSFIFISEPPSAAIVYKQLFCAVLYRKFKQTFTLSFSSARHACLHGCL